MDPYDVIQLLIGTAVLSLPFIILHGGWYLAMSLLESSESFPSKMFGSVIAAASVFFTGLLGVAMLAGPEPGLLWQARVVVAINLILFVVSVCRSARRRISAWRSSRRERG